MRMTKIRSLIIVIAFVMLGLPGYRSPSVFAQGGPPLITDDPGTPGDGKWEINIAFTIDKRQSGRSYESPLLDINYGLGENIQLKYEVPWLVTNNRNQRTKDGLGNSALGVKWRFLDQDKDRIDVSVYPQFEFNSSNSAEDRGLVDKGVEFVLPLQMEKSFGRISLNPEFGYVFKEYDENEWIYGLAAGYEASHNLELLAEISGKTGQDFEDDELVFNLGARQKFGEIHNLLLAAGRSFRSASSGQPEFLLYAGIQSNF